MQLNKLFIAIFGTLTGGFPFPFPRGLSAAGIQWIANAGSVAIAKANSMEPAAARLPERERMHDATTMKDYDRPYDLVIIGDLFAQQRDGMANHLIDAVWSVRVVHPCRSGGRG